jgi:hypothetical protein
MSDEIHSVDDLQYEWPKNLLRFDMQFIFGLSANDLLLAAVAGISLASIHLVLGLAVGLALLVLLVRLDSLGDRRLCDYLLARLRHRFAARPVVLPSVQPASQDQLDLQEILDQDGNVLVRFEQELT